MRIFTEDLLEVWSHNGEERGEAEAAGFLFETIPSALERSTLHEVVDGIGTLLGGANAGDVRKEMEEVFEESD